MGKDIANYADDNTPYVIADNIDDLIKSFEGVSTALIQWFDNNILKSNADKCHLVISSNESVTLHVGEYDIKNSKCEKLLGVKLAWKLKFSKSWWTTKCFSQNYTIHRIIQKTYTHERLF